jgi:hypothetical protein
VVAGLLLERNDGHSADRARIGDLRASRARTIGKPMIALS